MACLVNDFASFDTTEDPGGASIVERKDFQAKRPLWGRTFDKESINIVERLQECHQLQPITVLRVVSIDNTALSQPFHSHGSYR